MSRTGSKRPSLRAVLLVVNVTVLLLPLAGIWGLRLYESALVRQTESSLIAQAAFIAAAYKQAVLDRYGDGEAARESFLATLPANATQPSIGDGEPWAYRSAVLDLGRDPILPRPPGGTEPERRASDTAVTAGAALMNVLAEAQRTTLAAMRIVDTSGTVVGTTGDDLGLSLAHLVEIERALTGAEVSTLRERVSDEPPPPLGSMSRGTNLRVFVAMPVLAGDKVLGAVMLSRTPVSLSKALYEQRTRLLLGALGLLGVAFAMSVYTAFTIRRPIEALVRQSSRAVSGEAGAMKPLRAPVTAEFEALSAAVARMADTLEQRAHYVQDSMRHISHELKTPLTALIGGIELLRDHGETMSATQRDRFLANLDADAARLDHLLQRYLELARADGPADDNPSCDLGAALDALAAEYRALGLAVEIRGDTTDLLVGIGSEACDGIFRNLFENAREHAGANCSVTIEVEEHREAGLVVRFSDDGPGIEAALQAKVMQPFYTTTRECGGTGLGLALVASLLARHGGSVSLDPRHPGASFIMRFPAAGEPASVDHG